MTRQELLKAIRDKAYLEGDFTLRSGRRSDYYIDKYRFETEPAILKAVARELARFCDDSIRRIAGAELGGVPLAAATALVTGRPFVIIRSTQKDYGTRRAIEGALEPGDSVLFVEDVATTGGQVLEAARILTAAGARIARIVAVIDREEGAAEAIAQAGYPFAAIFTASDLRAAGR